MNQVPVHGDLEPLVRTLEACPTFARESFEFLSLAGLVFGRILELELHREDNDGLDDTLDDSLSRIVRLLA